MSQPPLEGARLPKDDGEQREEASLLQKPPVLVRKQREDTCAGRESRDASWLRGFHEGEGAKQRACDFALAPDSQLSHSLAV